MPFTAFDYRPADQLRQAPASGHTVDALDGFAARLLSGTPPAVNAPNTYPLTDGVELEVAVNGAAATTVTFNTADFVDITEATPTEVASVLGTALSGVTATVEGNFVRLTTDAVGPSASLQIEGGDANDALVFPTDLVTGSAGTATLVLGADREGVTEVLLPGDLIRAEQALTFDESHVQLTGAIRVPEMPSGVSWQLSLTVGGTAERSFEYDTPGTFSLNDIALTAAQSAGAATFGIELRALGLAVAGTEVELPAVYIDLVRSVSTTDVQLINRFPYPDQLDVPAAPLEVAFELASGVNGVAVDTGDTRIYVDAVEVFDGSSFSGGWTGSVTVDGTERIFSMSNAGPFDSEQEIDIRVTSEHTDTTGAIDTTYSITTADTEDLALSSAQARDRTTVRLQFNDDVDQALATAPGNYVFETLTVPAVSVTAVAVAMVGTDAVDITVDFEWSQGADYRVTVLNVTDTSGNALDSSNDSAEFAGFLCDVPAGRNFQLWDFFPGGLKRRDETGEFRLFTLSLQDVVDQLLCSIDKWTEIIDIDLAPEAFVDAILSDLGNPFDFIDLSLTDKRRLARILVDIYKTKGTEEGLIDAVRFLTGIDVTLDILNERSDFWVLGVSTLGNNTNLAPPVGSPLWYSFWIDSPVTLTDEQRDQILKIADYMKAAHEHILGLREPGTTTPADPAYWYLFVPGSSELGKTTILGD